MSRTRLIFAVLFAVIVVSSAAAQDATQTPTPSPETTPEATVEATVELTPEVTPESTSEVVVVQPLATLVNIRREPSIDSIVRGTLETDQTLIATGYFGFELTRGCTSDFTGDLDMWIRVSFLDRDGWIARCALKIVEGELAMLQRVDPPVEATPEATPEATAQP